MNILFSSTLIMALAAGSGHVASTSDIAFVRKILSESAPLTEMRKFAEPVALDLVGYDRHWEVEAWNGYRVIVISFMRGKAGQVLVFSPKGALTEKMAVGSEIRTVMLCDLGQRRMTELLIDQLDGWGTDVLERSFRLIEIRPKLKEIWKSSSLSLDSTQGKSGSSRSFVRCEPDGSSETEGNQLLYLTEKRQKSLVTLDRVSLRLVGEKLVKTPWPD